VALVAQAIGRRDRADANLVFNQSLSIAAVFTFGTLVIGYLVTPLYMASVGADAATNAAGATYLYWYLPGLALQFALVVMNAALRGTGIVKPAMLVQVLTVILNAVLAPVLIAGWGTGHPLGVAGAGLASTISIACGVVVLLLYFRRLERYVTVHADQWQPRFATWRRVLGIGLPAGGEFLLMFVIMAVVYVVIRGFGPDAQAGFGVGSRLMQAVLMPGMALAFAVAPVAGQNFGAQRHDRVRETFRSAAIMSTVLMAALTLFCHWRPELLVSGFASDAGVVSVGAEYLRIVSWNFIASGLIFCCSGMFQALGNTVPSLVSSATRLATFVVPALWLASHPDLKLHHVWQLSVTSVALQAAMSLWLLSVVMRRRLRPGT
jgi:putative MATE family efflux protein